MTDVFLVMLMLGVQVRFFQYQVTIHSRASLTTISGTQHVDQWWFVSCCAMLALANMHYMSLKSWNTRHTTTLFMRPTAKYVLSMCGTSISFLRLALTSLTPTP